jgi:flagellar protein FlgJ
MRAKEFIVERGWFDDPLGLGKDIFGLGDIKNPFKPDNTAADGGEQPTDTEPKSTTPGSTSNGNKTPLSFNKSSFISTMLPMAKSAAAAIGADPMLLIAQAAHETGWGESVLKNKDGSSSYNLFNIKAGRNWPGKTTSVSADEYINGQKTKMKSGFRSYNSFEESFNDYVNFLKTNPRYRNALSVANNPKSYIMGLQQAGYATDPNYAKNIYSTYQQLATA